VAAAKIKELRRLVLTSWPELSKNAQFAREESYEGGAGGKHIYAHLHPLPKKGLTNRLG
jgi:hypothetical protein